MCRKQEWWSWCLKAVFMLQGQYSVYISSFESVLQSLKIVYNIISAIFSLKTAKFPILDIYPWPWKQYPLNIIHIFFSLFYCYFSFNIATPSIFGNVPWILKAVGPYSLSTNKKKIANNNSNNENNMFFSFETRTSDTSSSPRKSIWSQNVFSGVTDKLVRC